MYLGQVNRIVLCVLLAKSGARLHVNHKRVLQELSAKGVDCIMRNTEPRGSF